MMLSTTTVLSYPNILIAMVHELQSERFRLMTCQCVPIEDVATSSLLIRRTVFI